MIIYFRHNYRAFARKIVVLQPGLKNLLFHMLIILDLSAGFLVTCWQRNVGANIYDTHKALIVSLLHMRKVELSAARLDPRLLRNGFHNGDQPLMVWINTHRINGAGQVAEVYITWRVLFDRHSSSETGVSLRASHLIRLSGTLRSPSVNEDHGDMWR